MVRTSCSHKRRPWEKYHFSKEKKGIVFSLGVLHSVREMQKALLLQKEFRMKVKNFKFNKYNFYCLKTTSCFPWVLNTIYFFMQLIFAGDLRHAWQSVVKQSIIYMTSQNPTARTLQGWCAYAYLQAANPKLREVKWWLEYCPTSNGRARAPCQAPWHQAPCSFCCTHCCPLTFSLL